MGPIFQVHFTQRSLSYILSKGRLTVIIIASQNNQRDLNKPVSRAYEKQPLTIISSLTGVFVKTKSTELLLRSVGCAGNLS